MVQAVVGYVNAGCIMFGGKKATIKHDGYSDGVLYRTCPHCGQRKPLSEFGLRAMKPGGQVREQSWCKACRSGR